MDKTKRSSLVEEDSPYATQTASARGHRRHVRAVLRARSECRFRAGRRAARRDPQIRSPLLTALVQDAETGEVVYGKNAEAVVPIASIRKLMTAMVVLDGSLDLDEKITLSREDAVQMKGSRSRLRTGLSLTRGELLLLAADVFRKPRRRRARQELPRRPRSLRRRDERQGGAAGHDREPLRRADRAFAGQRLDRERPREDGARRARLSTDPRVLHQEPRDGEGASGGRCSTATPTAWCARATGKSACPRPAISAKRAAAW